MRQALISSRKSKPEQLIIHLELQQLKDVLTEYQLSKAGSKEALIERLLSAAGGQSENTPTVLAADEGVPAYLLNRSDLPAARALDVTDLAGQYVHNDQAVQRPDTAHLAWVTGITFPLAIAAVSWLVAHRWPRFDDGRAQLVGFAAIAIVLVGVIPFYPARTYVDLVGQSFGHNRFGFPVVRGDRRFYFGSAEGARDAQQVVDALDADLMGGQRLIVGPADLSRANYSDAVFYHLFPELPPGTRYIEMDPGIADTADSGLADELRSTNWLILSTAWKDWTEPNDSANGRSQAPNKIVASQFCVVSASATFTLYRRCRTS
jgi:hypothetical protein